MPHSENPVSQSVLDVGTLKCPYKLCIVGGGPSGCSVLIRAVRIGVCDELCDFVYAVPPSSSKKDGEAQKPILGGVCIIDKGPPEKFGGGKLSEYQINSNTWANKFVTNITNDKLDVTPQESVKDTVLGRLKNMPNAIEVESYGTKNVPLCTVGALLCDAGRMICNQMYKFRSSSAVLTDTSAQAVYRVQTKTFVGWRVVINRKNTRGVEVVSEIYCKNLVMCTGGIQRLPVLPTASHNNKLLTSDFVCTTEGINEVKRRLMHHYLSVGPMAFHNGGTKVAIVGGSHSAFSAAWMCFHKITFPDCVVNPKAFIMNNNSNIASALSPTHNSNKDNKSFKLIHSARRAGASDECDEPASAATTVPASPTDFNKTVGSLTDTSVTGSCRTSFSVSVNGSEDRESVVMHGTISPKQLSRNKLRIDVDNTGSTAAAAAGAGGGGDCEEIVGTLSTPLASPTKSVGPHHIMTELPTLLNQLFHSPRHQPTATTQQQQQQALRSPSPQKASTASGLLSPTNRITSCSPATARKDLTNGPSFQRNSIVMLHRSPIEVFYATKSEADADNYPVEPSEIGKVTGQIHPFGGLRGDAKELWRSVRKGCTESRLKLVQVKGVTGSGSVGVGATESTNNPNNTNKAGVVGAQPGGHVVKNSLSDKILDDAVVIIWACGYNTNTVPIYDTSGEIIPLRIFRGQVEIDDKGNILAEETYQFSTELTKVREVSGTRAAEYFSSGSTETTSEATAATVDDDVTNNAKAAAIDAATAILMEGAVFASTSNIGKDMKDNGKKTSTTVTSSTTTSTPATSTAGNSSGSCKIIPNLMGNGLGYGFKATLENGQLDGSSGRADGVAVYLKRGATLILAKVLGNKVYGEGNFKSWEERNQAIRKQNNFNARSSLEEKEKLVAATNKTMNDIIASVNNLTSSAAGGSGKSVSVSAPVTPGRKNVNALGTSEKAKATPTANGGGNRNGNNQTVDSAARRRLNSAPSNTLITTSDSGNSGNSGVITQKSMPLPLNLEQSLSRLSQPRVVDTSNTLYTSGDIQRAKAAAAVAASQSTINTMGGGGVGGGGGSNKNMNDRKVLPVKRNNFIENTPASVENKNSNTNCPSPTLKNRVISNNTSSSEHGGGGGKALPSINQKGETPPHSGGSMTGSLLSDSDLSGRSISETPMSGTAAAVTHQQTQGIPPPGKQVKLSLPQIKSAAGSNAAAVVNSQKTITIYSPEKAKAIGLKNSGNTR